MALYYSELNASQGNLHLQRAILRLLQRPLTVLLSNLSTALLPLLSSPSFSNPSAPTVQNPNSNAVQAHALGISVFAGELLDCLDELKLDANHDHKGDGLSVIKEGLGSVMKRVINPLMSGIRADLVPLIQDLEKGNVAAVPSTAGAKVGNGAKGPVNLHPVHCRVAGVDAHLCARIGAILSYEEQRGVVGNIPDFYHLERRGRALPSSIVPTLAGKFCLRHVCGVDVDDVHKTLWGINDTSLNTPTKPFRYETTGISSPISSGHCSFCSRGCKRFVQFAFSAPKAHSFQGCR